MRYTMQRGKHVVKAGEVCGNLRQEVQIAGKTKRVGLPTKVWEDVMSVGFAAHPVGELVDAGKKTSRIIWARVPTQSDGREAMVLWHNHLVDLCRMTGREFRSLLAKNFRAEE